MKISSSNRREFLLQAGTLVSGLLFLPKLLAAEGRGRAAAPTPGAGGPAAEVVMADPKDSAASQVHFVKNRNQVKDPAVAHERQGVPWAGQQCSTCSLYQKVEGHKGGEIGLCPIVGGKGVPAIGFCQSWVKKNA